jgi:hypothetical protein
MKEIQMAEPQSQASHAQLLYVDRPDVSETFADHLENIAVDGPTLRLEFTVNRLDTPQQPATAPVSGKRYTACRLVLPATALMSIATQINSIVAALQATGTLKMVSPGSAGGKAN